MKNLSLTFLVGIFFINLSWAQPKVVVFNGSNDTEKPIIDYRNLIKLSVLEIFSGDVSLYYERLLSENVSMELGLGFTIDDYLDGLLEENSFNNDENKTSRIGVSTAIGFRYYPFLAAEEFYFAPELKYRYYHNDYEVGTTESPLTLTETKRLVNPRITVGYVYFFDDKIFVDMFAGVGIGFNKRSDISSVYDNENDAFIFSLDESKSPTPRLSLGVKFGFTF